MGVFISSNFIDLLLSSSSVVVFRCLVLRSFMSTSAFGLPVSSLSTPMAYVIPCWAWWSASWVGLCAVSTWVHTVCWRFPALMRFVLLPYGIDCLLFLQSHGLSVVWNGDMCSAHFEHLRCGCLQVKCEQLLDEFLVVQGSDESVLDVPFLFLIWWEVASVSKSTEMVNEFIWWLSGSDANIFQLIDPAVLGHCMIHRRGQVVHEGWSLLFLLWNLISCASWLPTVKFPATSVTQKIEHVFQSSQVGFCIRSSSWGCFCWNILKGEPTFHWFAKQLKIIVLLCGVPVKGWGHKRDRWLIQKEFRKCCGQEQQLDLLGQVLPWLDAIKEERFEATEGNNLSEGCKVVCFHNRWVDFNESLTQYSWGIGDVLGTQ